MCEMRYYVQLISQTRLKSQSMAQMHDQMNTQPFYLENKVRQCSQLYNQILTQQAEMSAINIFTKQPQSQNIFGGQTQPQSNNNFNNNSSSQQQQGSSMFNNSRSTSTSNNIFNTNSQGQGGTNHMFNNNNNNQQQGSNHLFNRTGGGTNILNQNQGSSSSGGTNLFSQGGTTLFSQPTSAQTGGHFNNSYNQSTNNYNSTANKYPINPNCPVNQARVYEMLETTSEQQKKIFQNFEPNYLKQLITYYCKSLDSLKSEKFQLPADNPLRTEKVLKVATQLNIKPQIVQIKRAVRDNLTLKMKKLKEDKEKLESQSVNFSRSVFQKLQKYKEKLVVSVSQNKMMEDVKQGLDDIEFEIKDFFTPLFNAHQTKNYVNFVDPNPFCISLSEKLLKNISMLENRVDEILACETDESEETIDTGDVILQLIEYYQNVAVLLKDYSLKYNALKRKAMQRSGQRNPEDTFRKISEKANSIVKKEMEGYDLVKEIENLLEKREKRVTEKKQ